MIEVPSLTFVHSFQFISSQCKFLGRRLYITYSKFSFILPSSSFQGMRYTGVIIFGLLQKGGGEGGILGSPKRRFFLAPSLLQIFFFRLPTYFRDAIRTSRKIHIKWCRQHRCRPPPDHFANVHEDHNNELFYITFWIVILKHLIR